MRSRLDRLVAAAGPRRAARESPRPGEADPAPEEGSGVEPPSASPVGITARLAAAVRLTRGHAWAVALLVLVGVVASSGWALRARAVEVSAPVQATAASSGGQSGVPQPPSPATAPTPALIAVHVLGAVVRPGVVSLPAPARVRDAIAAAGGLRPDADPGELNLAALVGDGSQVVIGTTAQPRGEVRGAGAAAAMPQPGQAASAAAVVDLNLATAEQLDQLPGVGPVTVQAILSWRAKHGRFGKVEELREVDGIGPKTYAQLVPHVRV